jgi:heme/copper-type cytochrome/quinol oxidase subunit 4
MYNDGNFILVSVSSSCLPIIIEEVLVFSWCVKIIQFNIMALLQIAVHLICLFDR